MYVRRGPGQSAQVYGTARWQRARREFLRRNPHCKFCADWKIKTLATVVDHIVPASGDARLFWDQRNWQALCKRCHNMTKRKIEWKKAKTDAVMNAKYAVDADGWITGLKTRRTNHAKNKRKRL